MLISELDLCKREWLELVFADRNKTYGAYELRTRYNTIMFRAVAATVFVISALAVTANVISHNRHVEDVPPVVITEIGPPPKIKKPDEIIKVKPQTQPPASKAAAPVSTKQYIPFVVKPDPQVTTPPEELKATDNPGQTTVTVPNSGGVAPIDAGDGAGNSNMGPGNGVTEDPNAVFVAVEDMPQPVGGSEAWAKFLQKNLRFPAMAQDAGVSGKVYLSFVIEKDGHLTDIKVMRKVGFGFDEEALRVLKLAPAWKPGKQNGNPVRVQYTIPINFQINADN